MAMLLGCVLCNSSNVMGSDSDDDFCKSVMQDIQNCKNRGINKQIIPAIGNNTNNVSADFQFTEDDDFKKWAQKYNSNNDKIEEAKLLKKDCENYLTEIEKLLVKKLNGVAMGNLSKRKF